MLQEGGTGAGTRRKGRCCEETKKKTNFISNNMDNKPPARPASLLTGHRVRKTKHLSRIKKPKEKRPKQDEDENDHEENQEIHDVDEGSDAVKEHPQKKQKHPPPPRPAKRSRSIDPMVKDDEILIFLNYKSSSHHPLSPLRHYDKKLKQIYSRSRPLRL